jgi:hypothetical protein
VVSTLFTPEPFPRELKKLNPLYKIQITAIVLKITKQQAFNSANDQSC